MKPEYQAGGGGKFLRAGNVKTGEFIQFLDGGTEEEGKYGMQTNMKVMYKGEEKLLSLKKTSYMELSPHYGEDTEDWIGKSAVLNIVDYSDKGFPPGIKLSPCIAPPTEEAKVQKSIEEQTWDES